LFFVFFGCKTQAPVTEKGADPVEPEVWSKTAQENPENLPYFKASGNEPFWNFTIAETGVEFKSLIEGFEEFKTPYSEPVRAMDANVKRYTLETEARQLIIQIIQNECINSMSGEASPYRVTLEIKNTSDAEFTRLEGCGNYITDYRLHDIWVLKTLNGGDVSLADFSKELPYLEINSGDNTFMGHAGCNRITGTIFYEKGLLRFTDAATTLMACTPENRESDYLNALQRTTNYSIENNSLSLYDASGVALIFKKVD
jgi:heat shock protein HslJ/uncharacterized membrane protein